MPANGTHFNMDFQVETPLSRLLDHLQPHVRKPDLRMLATSVVESFAAGSQIEAVSFAANPALTALLDSGWNRLGHHLLVGGRTCATRWMKLEGEWPSLLRSDQLEWGNGALPGDSSLRSVIQPRSSGKTPGDWARFQVLADGRSAVFVTLVFKGCLATHPEWGQEVVQMQQGLQMLCDLWTEVTALDEGNRQLATEKQALSRLNRLQGRFVGMASHEFKTPLTSISAYADALLGQVDDAQLPHAAEFLGVIRTEAGRLLRMVNRILDFSRMEYGVRLLGVVPLNLVPLVEETIRTLRPAIAAKQQTCVLECCNPVPRANVDADLIRQVLVNLMGNAVKFTPEGGGITVTLAEVESAVEVRIADTGPGIPQHDIHRIFREFYRSRETASHQEGTGLGLTIVRHIINLHGGHVEARQRLGGGSVFSFRVPKEVHDLGSLPAACMKKVDEADARRLIGMVLQLIAEMAGSKSVTMKLIDEKGSMVPVAGLGIESFSETVDQISDEKMNLHAAMMAGHRTMGSLIVRRPVSGRKYGAPELEQLQVLSRVAANSVKVLDSSFAADAELSSSAQVGKTIEALRTLLQIRRQGVPTAAVEAIHLLGILAREMNLSSAEISDLQYAAALHDAGMARVEDEILLGETELSFDERDEVDRHVEQGVDLMSPLLPSAQVAEVIRHHHERFDGSGYPDGLKGKKIPVGARLLAVIDAWFSLTMGRTFRTGLPRAEALREIHENAGSQFDTEIVEAFERILTGESNSQEFPMQPGPSGLGI